MVKNLSSEFTIFNYYNISYKYHFLFYYIQKLSPNMTTFTFQIYCHERIQVIDKWFGKLFLHLPTRKPNLAEPHPVRMTEHSNTELANKCLLIQ